MNRIFLLSPALCTGKRAEMILDEDASFVLARRLRSGGAPLGEVFAFVSGLYFRGKLAYATRFARPPAGAGGVLVITPSRGLMPAEEPVGVDCLREFASVSIDLGEPRYRVPLSRDAEGLAALAGDGCELVLLGSIATEKYAGVLGEALGTRLRFPPAFIGRGDMSRGGLMLRCVDEDRELDYAPFDGLARRGPRATKLEPRRTAATRTS
jgi:hypothetical protein